MLGHSRRASGPPCDFRNASLSELGERISARACSQEHRVWVRRLCGTLLSQGSRRAELVLRHRHRRAILANPHNPARHNQLHRRLVPQKHWPRNGEFDVQAHWQRTPGVEQNPAARQIHRLSNTCVQHATAANQLPPQFEVDPVASILPAVAMDAFNFFNFFRPFHIVNQFPRSLVFRTSPLCGGERASQQS